MRSKFLFFLIVALAGLVLPMPAAHAAKTFSEADIRGSFGFSWDGFVTVPSVGAVPAAAVGRFSADGGGNITEGVRTLVVGGVVSTQTFTCTYTVNPDGTGSASCTVVTTAGPAPGGSESFDFVIIKRTEAHFVGTTPGTTIRGIAKRQSGGHEDD